MTELLPCPFCGGPAGYEGKPGDGYFVACGHCGARSGWGDYGYQVEAKWNKRPSLKPTTLEHWRQECGKLHAQIETLRTNLRQEVQVAKDQRNEYQKRAQQAERKLAEFAKEENWRQGRRFDPNSAIFDGITFATHGLDIEECGNHSAGSPPR